MKLYPYLSKVVSSAALFVIAAPANADLIQIPDALDQTGNFTVTTDIEDITGEESIYLVSTMKISNESGEYLFGNLYLETSPSTPTGAGAQLPGVGNVVNTDDWGVNGNGGSSDDSPTNYPSGIDVMIDTPTTMVLKMNQITGDWSYWLSPDLTQSEPVDPTLSGVNPKILEGIGYIRLRGGRYGAIPFNSNLTSFTNVALYTGDDSPFNVVTPRAPILSNLSYNPATGDSEVILTGTPSTSYILVGADDLDFDNPGQSPVPLTAATIGSLNGNLVTTDANGDATVQFNLGAGKSASFIRAEEAP